MKCIQERLGVLRRRVITLQSKQEEQRASRTGEPQRRRGTVDSSLNISQVADLIEEDDIHWKEELMQELFLPVDAEAILSIPIGWGYVDRLVWHCMKNDRFSVRSAYHLAHSMKEGDRGSSGNQASKNHWDLSSDPECKAIFHALHGRYSCEEEGKPKSSTQGIDPASAWCGETKL
ncbi:hypothetical protein Salat_2754600 [Sesamum alatum]|uniref:Uncharacterized protein n=1 Tax=Sesamum alatum TaxID=300844 RepID=A0AAE2C982_9LAMI|nr:hypothetical protein Salat_2754600 [Sesamum alatum]